MVITRKFIVLSIVLVLLSSTAYFIYRGIEDFDIENISHKDLVFTSQGDELAATLFVPKQGISDRTPVAIFIHGDGDQDRTSNSGYLPLISYLVENGIAVFSWDKKGLGKSEGNWLDQSILDRAIEAKDAFNFLTKEVGFSKHKTGYLGFSQGGWVIPKAAQLTTPAFSVIIGGAINWLDQGAFYTGVRLKKQGIPLDKIKQKVDSTRRADSALFSVYSDSSIAAAGVSKDRFLFIARNFRADATVDIQEMRGPLLALWGQDDLNVPAFENALKYRQITANRQNGESIIKIYESSTHGLLKAQFFNYQLDSQWPEWKKCCLPYRDERPTVKIH